jgi:hypothetical protein
MLVSKLSQVAANQNEVQKLLVNRLKFRDWRLTVQHPKVQIDWLAHTGLLRLSVQLQNEPGRDGLPPHVRIVHLKRKFDYRSRAIAIRSRKSPP